MPEQRPASEAGFKIFTTAVLGYNLLALAGILYLGAVYLPAVSAGRGSGPWQGTAELALYAVTAVFSLRAALRRRLSGRGSSWPVFFLNLAALMMLTRSLSQLADLAALQRDLAGPGQAGTEGGLNPALNLALLLYPIINMIHVALITPGIRAFFKKAYDGFGC